MKTIYYKSENGYVGEMRGKGYLSVIDAFGRKVLETHDRFCKTYSELKELVDFIPEIVDKLR